MKTFIRTFLSGALVMVPLIITVWALYSVGSWLDWWGAKAILAINERTQWLGKEPKIWPGVGAVLLIGAIYVVGLLTRLWAFRMLWGHFEGLLGRVPGVKVIYESVRDLIKLFGGAGSIGRAVEFRPPGTDVAVLGILTNENPAGGALDNGQKRVAVYLPLAYMLGGPTVLTSPEHLRELNIPVEQALKLAATAYVSGPPSQVPEKKKA